uniref:Uncharacterized protein n=1 Tax=Lotharella oceanica TaxID=641309 RepID=A0A7S2XEF4_9EUKA|mmetsp:Transcript_32157/g.59874  ORF Transcript_32157/g.59874 Transcript_32157/m.59874 type:complete len:316 (+) Transcript_32157:111-1058(+)
MDYRWPGSPAGILNGSDGRLNPLMGAHVNFSHIGEVVFSSTTTSHYVEGFVAEDGMYQPPMLFEETRQSQYCVTTLMQRSYPIPPEAVEPRCAPPMIECGAGDSKYPTGAYPSHSFQLEPVMPLPALPANSNERTKAELRHTFSLDPAYTRKMDSHPTLLQGKGVAVKKLRKQVRNNKIKRNRRVEHSSSSVSPEAMGGTLKVRQPREEPTRKKCRLRTKKHVSFIRDKAEKRKPLLSNPGERIGAQQNLHLTGPYERKTFKPGPLSTRYIPHPLSRNLCAQTPEEMSKIRRDAPAKFLRGGRGEGERHICGILR